MGELATTNRRRLREAANGGYVTPAIAEEVGAPAIEVRKLAVRGGLEHVSRGLYRFPDLVADERAPFYEAVLSVGPDAYLTRDSVLAFHDLGFVNPRRIRVGTTRRVRRNLPAQIEVIRDDLPASDRTVYDGLPSATVERALRDCIGSIMSDRLVDAVDRARDKGLLRSRDRAHRRRHGALGSRRWATARRAPLLLAVRRGSGAPRPSTRSSYQSCASTTSAVASEWNRTSRVTGRVELRPPSRARRPRSRW